MPPVASTSGHLHCELCEFHFCRFFATSGNELAQYNQDTFHFRRAAVYSKLKSKVGMILGKATAMCVNLQNR
jgi:hypothetical protein